MHRTLVALYAVLVASTTALSAQQEAAERDSARIHTTLRAFYFNLAHQDWEAMAADILPAKVVAHRPAPEALVLAAGSSPASDEPAECTSRAAPLVDQATITLDGDWAEVSVPRCVTAPARADEFRLIHFERRWRFVYIDVEKGRPTGASER